MNEYKKRFFFLAYFSMTKHIIQTQILSVFSLSKYIIHFLGALFIVCATEITKSHFYESSIADGFRSKLDNRLCKVDVMQHLLEFL